MESLTNNNTQKEIEKNDQILNKNSSNILSKILNSSIPETNIQKKIMKVKKTISKIPFH